MKNMKDTKTNALFMLFKSFMDGPRIFSPLQNESASEKRESRGGGRAAC